MLKLKRLFYVAVTRAKDKLIISTVMPESRKNDSFTGLLTKGLGVDFSSSELNLTSTLKLLKKSKDDFYTEEEKLDLSIPIITDVEEITPAEKAVTEPGQEFIINLDTIEDSQKGEIISATKFSVYKECPLKYNLIYQYGFSELHNIFRQGKAPRIETPDEEEEITVQNRYADVKGSIIHKILQQELSQDELNNKGLSKIESELKSLVISEREKNLLSGDILSELSGYYSSALYKKIKGYKDFQNEFNIYLKKEDYFLYGIIDKFVRNNENGIIIDYKTDDIRENEIEERSSKYFNQLKFYSYIVKSAFKNLAEIELRIVYLKYPEKDVSLLVTPEIINGTGADISRMVQEIRGGNYKKNYDHCRKCYFFINNSECIIN